MFCFTQTMFLVYSELNRVSRLVVLSFLFYLIFYQEGLHCNLSNAEIFCYGSSKDGQDEKLDKGGGHSTGGMVQ